MPIKNKQALYLAIISLFELIKFIIKKMIDLKLLQKRKTLCLVYLVQKKRQLLLIL